MTPRLKTFRWQEMHQAMMRQVSEVIEHHNLQYPTKSELNKAVKVHGGPTLLYPRSYTCRVKTGEKNTIMNVLRQWCKQTAQRIRKGEKLITNVVFTNRKDARASEGSPRVTNRHLAKGALVGIFVGEEASEDDGKEYLFGEKTYIKPLKKWHGTNCCFELLIDPRWIPLGCLPRGVELLPLEDFEAKSPPMQRKTPHLSVKLETYRNKEINQAAVDFGVDKAEIPAEERILQMGDTPKSPNLKEAGNTFEAGNSEGVSSLEAELQALGQKIVASEKENSGGGAPEAKTPPEEQEVDRISDKPPQNAGNSVKNPDASWTSTYQRYVDGQVIGAYADRLVQSYQEKLATAMDRHYHPTEIKRARQAARQLLEAIPPDKLEERVEVLFKTIDHMQQWILYTGKFVMHPSKWFAIDYQANIYGAFDEFLKPWMENAQKFREQKPPTLAEINADQQRLEDEQAKISDWHGIAFQLKYALLEIHPHDRRLRHANITRWAWDFYRLVQVDKYAVEEVVKLANWLVANKESERAHFWRKEAGGFGIRSAGGFRKHFAKMREQAGQDLVNELKYKGIIQEAPGSKRIPSA